MAGPLADIRVLDLSRVLAGPVCTQILGDLGAEIIKVEQPGKGDDTRQWGPPFLLDDEGRETTESAYYLCANRNKRSVAVDLSRPEGQALIQRMAGKCNVLIENFKTGGLKKYGLDYEALSSRHPALIYCSITGFGHTGPLATEPGYDFVAQAMGGLMAITGDPAGEPMKAGVALSDVMTGLYAAIGILSALHHRQNSGKGQHIDLALLDCTMAGMCNIAQYYLTSGKGAPRQGNAHATIVPYQTFATADGHIVIAIGNDSQFRRFCNFIDRAGWADDPLFSTNAARVCNRQKLVPLIAVIMAGKTTDDWVAGLRTVDVPAGPVNTMAQAFSTPQAQARAMNIEMRHPLSSRPVHLVGSPLKLSATPVAYRHAPPVCGQDTRAILKSLLDLNDDELAKLETARVVA